MFPASIKRPALGQLAGLGWLYDARQDKFLPSSILRGTLADVAVSKVNINMTDTKFSNSEGLNAKFDNMGINNELGASWLANLLNVEGAARYLEAYLEPQPFVHETLYYTTSTVHEKLNLACNEVRDVLDFTQLANGEATHVVTEIQWGQNTIVAGRKRLSADDRKDQVESNLKAALRKLETPLIPVYADPNRHKGQQSMDNSFQFTIYTDVLSRDTFEPNTFDVTLQFVSNLPSHIEGLNQGKGMPIIYTLLPVGFFSIFYGAQVSHDITILQPSTDCLKKLINVFDESHVAQNALDEYLQKLSCHQTCVPRTYIDTLAAKLRQARISASDLKDSYTQAIKDIRNNKKSPQALWEVHDAFMQSEYAPSNLLALTQTYTDKIDFIDSITTRGGKYLGYGSSSFEAAMLKTLHSESYAFYFSQAAQRDKDSWTDNTALLFDLLQNKRREALIAVVDTDATDEPVDRVFISHFKDAQLLIKDMVEQQKMLADKCLMKYQEHAIDRSFRDVPAQRRMVKIPCPGAKCDPNVQHNWICFKCYAPSEYSPGDRSVYCDCGRCPFDAFSFKCKAQSHGQDFERFKSRALLQLLENLDPPPELNVLILGSTGVGKSTFINAFINYLTFASLDEGLSAAKLNCIIPCSFDTQYVDQTNGGKLMQKEVRFGYDEDERSAKGQSATQKTTVYPLYIGNTLVRLIDTPGIGDTRGIEQDRKNMVDVLSVLRNYDKLHGILILLKPNESRLNVMFRFCIKELLVHLHRSCARNMVFGFTNTRGSNYQPGDTFRPLEALLSEFKDVIPGLFRETVYCFDSESFRYLAARQQGRTF